MVVFSSSGSTQTFNYHPIMATICEARPGEEKLSAALLTGCTLVFNGCKAVCRASQPITRKQAKLGPLPPVYLPVHCSADTSFNLVL